MGKARGDSEEYFGKIAEAVSHPVETVEAMAQSAGDTYEKEGLAFMISYAVTDAAVVKAALGKTGRAGAVKAADKADDAADAVKVADKADDAADVAKVKKGVGGAEGWDMVEGGGKINGREYSQHAMKRMAPDTPSVRAELARRAEKLAESKGLQMGTDEYYQFCQKYVDPRNIPPSVIEDAISSTKRIPGNTVGTIVHETADVKVIVNFSGKVVRYFGI